MPATTQVSNLVTTHTFNGQDYIIKLSIVNSTMELCVTDKQVAEEWQCTYDQTFIENLTLKTGNFKSFDVFAIMIKSGLLKTSRSIALDLLTYDDLQGLSSKFVRQSRHAAGDAGDASNRRYLILAYTVEFDRIFYPLPLDYCGPPDVKALIATVRNLENELAKAKHELAYKTCTCNHQQSKSSWKALEAENKKLTDDVRHLKQKLQRNSCSTSSSTLRHNKSVALEAAITKLESSVLVERQSHQKLVDKLRMENTKLQKEIKQVRMSETSLKQRLNGMSKPVTARTTGRTTKFANAPKPLRPSSVPLRTAPKPSRSRASSKCSSKRSSSCESQRTIRSKPSSEMSSCSSQNLRLRLRNSEHDFQQLESRINGLQKLLRSNFNIQ